MTVVPFVGAILMVLIFVLLRYERRRGVDGAIADNAKEIVVVERRVRDRRTAQNAKLFM